MVVGAAAEIRDVTLQAVVMAAEQFKNFLLEVAFSMMLMLIADIFNH